ncbi:MAG: efflux RND transporter periplasmic adaptor subunit [Elusimicrobiaceae bacterium]|nr:efflux RND transporter periplasmic adaptor subunit [Elusimicrobiaceae bacterium]
MKKETIITCSKYALVLLLGGVLGFIIKGKLAGGGQMNMGGAAPASVLTQTMKKRTVALGKNFIAKVEAINASDVIPQVSGYIDKVLFEEGSFVKEGDVLFVIDQARYKAAVTAAEADLEKAKATEKQQASHFKREQSLYKEKMLSQADLEVAESNYTNAQANVKAAQASLDLARLNLEYTEVKSPISGYIGKALMTKGNYTNAAVSKLARVIQMDPVRVVFSITDKERLSGMDQLTTHQPDIQVALPNGETIDLPSANVFSDNEINAQTATMAVYAQADNAQNKLIPGNYVNVTVSLDKFRPMILVPQTSVSQDAVGQYVMTVDDNDTIVQKYIALGDVVGTNYVVVSGLEDGDRVVTIGQQKLQNGQKVTVSQVEAESDQKE